METERTRAAEVDQRSKWPESRNMSLDNRDRGSEPPSLNRPFHGREDMADIIDVRVTMYQLLGDHLRPDGFKRFHKIFHEPEIVLESLFGTGRLATSILFPNRSEISVRSGRQVNSTGALTLHGDHNWNFRAHADICAAHIKDFNLDTVMATKRSLGRMQRGLAALTLYLGNEPIGNDRP